MEPRLISLLRTAILSRQWKRAERLLPEFRTAVETAWVSLESDEQRRQLQVEVSTILDWARAMTLAGRAQDHDNLLQMARRGAYVETQRRAGNVEVEA